MEIIEHGRFFQDNCIINCLCGCKYRYNTNDIKRDTSLAYTTCPSQYEVYVVCPECGAITRLGTTISSVTSNEPINITNKR